MSEPAAVLFGNEAFYAAFASRDIAAMDAIWSQRQVVTCIHPGWPPLFGRTAVLQSWNSILRNPNSPRVTSSRAAVQLVGELGYVICYEDLPSGFLIATNIFVFEDRVWKIIHHQAGTVPPPPRDERQPPTPPTMQ